MTLRVAIAGAGFIGAVHAHAGAPRAARWSAVLASSPERSDAAARRLGAERAASGVEELVAADEVDVVHVCTPNHLTRRSRTPLWSRERTSSARSPWPSILGARPASRRRAGRRRSPGHGAVRLPLLPDGARGAPAVDRQAGVVSTGPRRLPAGLAVPAERRQLAGRPGARRPVPGVRRHRLHWCDLAEFVTGPPRGALSARTLTAVPERRPRRPADVRARDGRGEPVPVETEDAAVVQFETDGGALGARGGVAGLGRPQEPALAGGGRRAAGPSRSTRRTPRRCGPVAAT